MYPLPEAYTELAELAGGFIHDLKNHLSTLGLNLQLLSEDFADAQNQKERRALQRVERLRKECQRLVDLSNDFLRYARIQSLDVESTSIADILGEMVDFFTPTAREANVRVQAYLPVDLPPVLLDRELFKQAVLNLMLNAEQAMPDGGELTFQARPDRGGVAVDIIDTGTGIPPELIPKIFRPFHTTKPGGNGLGLPTVRKIIRAHGGTIEVQSAMNHGTKFTIWLPGEMSLPAPIFPNVPMPIPTDDDPEPPISSGPELIT
ncbi:two-component system sensor histidine kinase NtrB [Tuwongella immobilis]|uniref:histidine kinase n=1 Tax=Tuwongella immobilis TaxID=692036 RepID=A0A6C2YKQ1_9BACT|nr:HAMP domain-containing sensor histidine kinase [Tuwongella immobilis]VIP01957.1 histidine kinase : Histidine kinase OS=uncultured planctomycete GN=HGMM_F12C05C13 PE=4 SV=1: HisKA: HATPase_c [Tuwongella immobilis]VTR99958.1 histidine kinase : Histidine kinase OS=uncultured planctomycete GN=HGMM_F12C05C13 PE=4 SV=1: HisKA: HATPase_c [Tuwongella immobilis]